MIDTSFLRQLDRFDIILKKRVLSKYSGSRESRFVGGGLVFKDYKDYVAGDDFRAIDWKVFARTDELFIRRFEEEKNMRVHVIIDSSASMNFGAEIKKFEYASMVALGFCYMALKNNNSFEVSTFSDDLNVFRPQKGMSKLISIVDILNKKSLKGKSKFTESLEKYKDLIKTKSVVVIISDFLFDPAELRQTLYRFKKSDIILVQVLDVTEKDIRLDGDNILVDSESNETLRTFISNRFKQNYAEKLQEHIDAVKDIAEGYDMRFISTTTDTPVFDVFYEVLRQ